MTEKMVVEAAGKSPPPSLDADPGLVFLDSAVGTRLGGFSILDRHAFFLQ